MTDPVTEAADLTDYDTYVTRPDGRRLTQSTHVALVHDMLRLLDVRTGHRVLEVGTGSAYTTALLARLVGPCGLVVSIDIDTGLVQRAERKLRADDLTVQLHVADGFHGWADSGPYDRIIAWATPHVIPLRWVEQAIEGAAVLTPVKVAPLASANALIRCVVQDGEPTNPRLHPGSFIEMHNEVIPDIAVPVRYVDATSRAPDSAPAWISAAWLRQPDVEPSNVFDRLLAMPAQILPDPFDGDDQGRSAFCAYLYALNTRDLTTAVLSDGSGVGTSDHDGIALLRTGDLFIAGTSSSRDRLLSWIHAWHQLGRPGHDALTLALYREPVGWIVRPRTPTES